MKVKKQRIAPQIDAFQVNQALNYIYQVIESLPFYFGKGDPNGSVIADKGSLYLNSDGGTNATLWVKESGVNDSQGWISK